MTLPRYDKHPDAIRNISVDVLGLGANTIGIVSTAITPVGMTVVSTVATDNQVVVQVSSGADGTLYQGEITINISNGERLIHEFEINVRHAQTFQRYNKHPDAIRGYPVNVAGLGANTIGAVSTAITPAGMTVISTTATGNQVVALISSGVDGTLYEPEITINISNGERLIYEFEIMVTDN